MSLRIPFDSVTLAAVVAELQPLVGGRIQKVVQPDRNTVVLNVYLKEEVPLLVCTDPDFYRLHLLTRRIQGAAEPPPFCMVLRKWLLNGRITSITQRGLDRIVDLTVSSAHGDYLLSAEFMGKHSNAILVGSDQKIVGAMKWVPEHKSKRPVLPLCSYLPPPFSPRPPLTKATPTDDLKDFEGVSPFLSRLINAGMPLPKVQSALQSGQYQTHYAEGYGAYPFDVSVLGIPAVPRTSISQALEQHFASAVVRHQVELARQSLLAQLRRVLLAREVARDSLQEAALSAGRAPLWQQKAELILAYQGTIQTGDALLEAWDYEGNPVQIPLDPDLTPVENANRLFDRAKRAKDRHLEVVEQLERIQSSLPTLEQTILDLETAESLAEVEAAKSVAERHKWLHHHPQTTKKEDRPYAGYPIRELESPGGWKVLYGTNATSNDYLTTKVAKPNDWWLHVRGQTSAHVVIQTHNQPEKVQRPDLEYAAQVAVRNSVAKNAHYVPVDYTLKKYVRKPRASAPGLAVYEREKTLHIDP